MRINCQEGPISKYGVFGTRGSHQSAQSHTRRGILSFASRDRYSCPSCLGKERQTHRGAYGHLSQHRENSCAPHLLKAGHSLARRAGHPSVWPFHEITFGVSPTSPSGANHFVACKHRDYRKNAGIYQDRLGLSCEKWLAQRCSARSSARPLYGGSYMFCQVARFYSRALVASSVRRAIAKP